MLDRLHTRLVRSRGLVVGPVIGVFGTAPALPAVAGFAAAGATFGGLVAWHLRHLPPPSEASGSGRRYG